MSLAGVLVVRWCVIGVLALVLWRKGLPRAAVFVVAVEVLGTLLNNLVKLGVDRIRPTFDVSVASASGSSFPSGHAMNSMICYSLVASALVFSGLVPGKAWAKALAAAVLVVPLMIGVARVARSALSNGRSWRVGSRSGMGWWSYCFDPTLAKRSGGSTQDN